MRMEFNKTTKGVMHFYYRGNIRQYS